MKSAKFYVHPFGSQGEPRVRVCLEFTPSYIYKILFSRILLSNNQRLSSGQAARRYTSIETRVAAAAITVSTTPIL